MPDPKAPEVTSEAGTAPAERVPTEVREELKTFAAKVAPVSVPAGAITAAVVMPVVRPLALIVMTGIAVEDPVVPAEATVAKVAATEPEPEAVTSPVRAVIVPCC